MTITDGEIRRLRDGLRAAAESAPTELSAAPSDLTRSPSRRGSARRFVAPAAAALAVAACATAGLALTGDDDTRDGGVAPAAPSVSRPAATPTTAANPVGTPIGDIVDTTTAYLDGRLSLWVERDAYAASHGLAVCIAARSGSAVPECGSTSPASTSSLAPGFHTGYDAGGVGADHHDYLLFGYVVAPRITAVTLQVDGKPVTARTATWSQNRQVHLWWAVGETRRQYRSKAQGSAQVSNLIARDGDRVVARGPRDGGIAHG